jgi:hypothetical protein
LLRSKDSGNAVDLPAPGGACKTTAPCARALCSWGRILSTGKDMSDMLLFCHKKKPRGMTSRAALFKFYAKVAGRLCLVV